VQHLWCHQFGYEQDSLQLSVLQEQAQADDRDCVVSAIIVNGEGRAFVQRRSSDRRLFPNCWDIAGGHVDPGETLYGALVREVQEETNWRIRRLVNLVAITDWEAEVNGRRIRRREFTFLVDVDGDMRAPMIERDKFSEVRWVGQDDLDVLKEYRADGDVVIYELVKKGLVVLRASAQD